MERWGPVSVSTVLELLRNVFPIIPATVLIHTLNRTQLVPCCCHHALIITFSPSATCFFLQLWQPRYWALWNLSAERLKRNGRMDDGLSWRPWKGGGEWKCFDIYGFASRRSLAQREPWLPQVGSAGVTTRPLLSPSASASLTVCRSIQAQACRSFHIIAAFAHLTCLWFIAYHSSISK